jgi:hypothetical protein
VAAASLPGASTPVPSAFDLGGYRPGAVALIVGDVFERRAAQAASGREKRDRLDAVGFAGSVRANQRHHVTARLKARRAIITEVRKGEAVDAGGGHMKLIFRHARLYAGHPRPCGA